MIGDVTGNITGDGWTMSVLLMHRTNTDFTLKTDGSNTSTVALEWTISYLC